MRLFSDGTSLPFFLVYFLFFPSSPCRLKLSFSIFCYTPFSFSFSPSFVSFKFVSSPFSPFIFFFLFPCLSSLLYLVSFVILFIPYSPILSSIFFTLLNSFRSFFFLPFLSFSVTFFYSISIFFSVSSCPRFFFPSSPFFSFLFPFPFLPVPLLHCSIF